MIELRDVKRSFTDGDTHLEVLKGVNWDIKQGESIALMGRSGSGKTTLLNLLGCLDRGYQGEFLLDGADLKKMSDKQLAAFRNQTIGMVFQSFHLMDQLTCEDNVLLPTWFSPKEPVPRERAAELLDKVGLASKARQYPHKLSGGEKQRIAIARALVMKPRLLLCDEPTGNLDDETREEILALFQTIHKETDLTLLVVTHEARTASIADRIFELQAGQLTEVKDDAPMGKE